MQRELKSTFKGVAFLVLIFIVAIPLAQVPNGRYVLPVGEGESTLGGRAVIKLSPQTGTQNLEIFTTEMAPGSSTWSHTHDEADEVWYVISGSGEVTIGETAHRIAQGDFVFIPAGEKHKVGAPNELMEALFLVDRPGLADNFREAHRRFQETGVMPELEETNEFAIPTGTTFYPEE